MAEASRLFQLTGEVALDILKSTERNTLAIEHLNNILDQIFKRVEGANGEPGLRTEMFRHRDRLTEIETWRESFVDQMRQEMAVKTQGITAVKVAWISAASSLAGIVIPLLLGWLFGLQVVRTVPAAAPVTPPAAQQQPR